LRVLVNTLFIFTKNVNTAVSDKTRRYSTVKMRTVSFVDSFELEFEGSIFSKAMLAADVDNDGVSISYVLGLW